MYGASYRGIVNYSIATSLLGLPHHSGMPHMISMLYYFVLSLKTTWQSIRLHGQERQSWLSCRASWCGPKLSSRWQTLGLASIFNGSQLLFQRYPFFERQSSIVAAAPNAQHDGRSDACCARSQGLRIDCRINAMLDRWLSCPLSWAGSTFAADFFHTVAGDGPSSFTRALFLYGAMSISTKVSKRTRSSGGST